MKKIGRSVVWMLSVAAVCALPVQGLASTTVGQDQVLSISIKPADGTSGQTVATGSGVKTGHIQDGAITDVKITGPISGAKLGAGTVGTAAIADGSITDAKITGPISTSKLNVGSTAGTVAAGDHNHDELYQKKYANVIVVAKSGGDFTDPVSALDSITDASLSNRYVVKIMPGIYTLTSRNLQMKEFVDIEGAGQETTKIAGDFWFSDRTAGLVDGASNAEIRNLSIEHIGTTGNYRIGIYNNNTSPKITSVTIIASGVNDNYGIMNVYDTYPTIDNVKISSEGYGIHSINYSGNSITIKNSEIKAGMGIFNVGSMKIKNTLILASGSAIGYSTSGTLQIADSEVIGSASASALELFSPTYVTNSKIEGAINNHNTTIKCIGAFNGNYEPISCQ